MYTGRPLFPGKTNQDQLVRIFKALGTPSEQTWPRISELAEWKKGYPVFPAQPLQHLLPMIDTIGLDLLGRMLVYQPQLRIGADEATKHAYFEDVPPAIKNMS